MPVLSWCKEASAVLQDLTSEKSCTDCVVFGIDNPKTKTPIATLVDSGAGGRGRLVQWLSSRAAPSCMYVGVFLCSALDEVGSSGTNNNNNNNNNNVVSVQRKYIQVTWVGPAVSVMAKGRMSSWTADLRQSFPHCALSVACNGQDNDWAQDLDENVLATALAAAGGAHKPTRYSFTNKTLIGSLQLHNQQDDQAAERVRREEEMAAQRAAAAERKRIADEKKRVAAQEAERQAALEARRIEEEARRIEEEARRKAQQQQEERLARIQAQEAQRQAELEAKRQAQAEAERQRDEAERLARQEAERQRTKILIDVNATLADGKTLVVLVSSMTSNFAQSTHIDRVRTMIQGLGLPKTQVQEVDGSDPDCRQLRNELFTLSGIRAKYPQVFLRLEDETTLQFVGDFDAMEYYNDTGTLAKTLGVISSATERVVAVGDCTATAPTKSDMEPTTAKADPQPSTMISTTETSTQSEMAEMKVAEPSLVVEQKSVESSKDDAGGTTCEPATETMPTAEIHTESSSCSMEIPPIEPVSSVSVKEKPAKSQNEQQEEAGGASASEMVSETVEKESVAVPTKEIEEKTTTTTERGSGVAVDVQEAVPLAEATAPSDEEEGTDNLGEKKEEIEAPDESTQQIEPVVDTDMQVLPQKAEEIVAQKAEEKAISTDESADQTQANSNREQTVEPALESTSNSSPGSILSSLETAIDGKEGARNVVETQGTEGERDRPYSKEDAVATPDFENDNSGNDLVATELTLPQGEHVESDCSQKADEIVAQDSAPPPSEEATPFTVEKEPVSNVETTTNEGENNAESETKAAETSEQFDVDQLEGMVPETTMGSSVSAEPPSDETPPIQAGAAETTGEIQ